MFVLAWFCSLSIIIFTCLIPSEEEGLVHGMVRDGSGNLLSHVSFEVASRQSTGWRLEVKGRTGDDGSFRIETLPSAAAFRFRIPPTDHFEGFRKTFRLPTNEALLLDAVLDRREHSTSGIIVHDQSFQPVADVRLRVFEHPQIYRRTSANGRFRLSGLAAVDYRIEVSHPLIPSVYTIYPVRGGDENVRIVLPKADSKPLDQAFPDRPEDLIGKLAPEGDGCFINENDGDSQDLSDQPIWLRFFVNYVRHTQSDLDVLSDEAALGGQIILVHSASAWRGGLRRWKQRENIKLRVFMDKPLAHAEQASGSLTWARFGVRKLPVDILIDRDRRVVAVGYRDDFDRTMQTWRELRDRDDN